MAQGKLNLNRLRISKSSHGHTLGDVVTKNKDLLETRKRGDFRMPQLVGSKSELENSAETTIVYAQSVVDKGHQQTAIKSRNLEHGSKWYDMFKGNKQLASSSCDDTSTLLCVGLPGWIH